MTSTHRVIRQTVVVVALAGTGIGLAGGISLADTSGGLTDPAPLPTTSPLPLSLPGGITDPLPLPEATDSPSPQPTDSAGATSPSSAPTDSTTSNTSAGPAGAGQSTTGQATGGTATGSAVTTTSTGQRHGSSSAAAKGSAVTSVPKVSAPTGLDLAKTAGGLTQGATAATLTAPQAGLPAPLTTLLHGLSMPDLPPLPGAAGSPFAAADSAQAPVVAAPPSSSGYGAAAAAGATSAQPYARASTSSPAGQRSQVAPALFALIAAAVAAGVAKVRIRWGRR